jgi:hypothetical protein
LYLLSWLTYCKRDASVAALLGFSYDDEPTVNSKYELTVATSGSHNLMHPSNCNLSACRFPL